MSKFPHLPLFTDAFIADTGHLSAQETGAYLMLLMVAWRSPGCRLPDDDAKLARWARVSAKNWPRVKASVMEFWTLADGFWTQRRLTKEHVSVSRRAEAARDNGSRGGRAKTLKTNEPANPVGSDRSSGSATPIPIPIATPNGVAASAAVKDPKTVASFIDRMLREFPVFGAQAASNFGLLSPTEINLWLGAGVDLALDVEPVVRSILGRPGKPPTSWKYFQRAVIEHRDTRAQLQEARAPALQVSEASRSFQNPDGTRRPSSDGAVYVWKVNLTGGGGEMLEPGHDRMVGPWQMAVRSFLKGGHWNEEHLGAPPGHPACLVPAEILAKLMPLTPGEDGTGSTARH